MITPFSRLPKGLRRITALGIAGHVLAVVPAMAQAPAFDIAGPAPSVSAGTPTAAVLDPALTRFPLAAERLQYSGENPTGEIAVFVTGEQSTRPAELVLTYTSAVSVAPETSGLTVLLNDVPLVDARLAVGGERRMAVAVPPGLLQPGYNAVRILLRQNHRVDCSVAGTYELWTRFDPATSGVRFGQGAAAIADMSELAALPRRSDGAVSIRGRVLPGATPGTVDRTLEAVQAAVLLGSFSDADVRLGSEAPGEPGLDILVGTYDELADVPQSDKSGNTAWQNVSFLAAKSGGRARLVVSGANAAEVDLALAALRAGAEGARPIGSPAGLRALANAKGHPISSRQSVTLAELGADTRAFSGRFFRDGVTLGLPADFYAADYDVATIALDAAYAAGLSKDAQLIVRANDQIAATLSLSSPTSGTIRNQRLRVPLQMLKPGANRIEFEAVLPKAEDESCDTVAGGTDANPRFVLGGSTRIEMPALAQAGHYPNLSATLAGVKPSGAGAPVLSLYVPKATPEMLDAAGTMIARMASGSGTVRDVQIVSAMPHEESGDLLVVGTYDAMPMELLEALRLRDADASLASASDWTSIIANAAPVAAPEDEPALAPANPPQADDFFAAAAAEPGLGSRLVDGVRPYVAPLLRQISGGDPSDVANRAPLPENALLIAQAPAPVASGAAWTLLAAPTAEKLSQGVRDLTEAGAWGDVGGSMTQVSLADRSLAVAEGTQERLFETQPRTVGNARLVLAGWFSRHTESYMGLVLGASVLLAFSTLLLLRRVGEKDRK